MTAFSCPYSSLIVIVSKKIHCVTASLTACIQRIKLICDFNILSTMNILLTCYNCVRQCFKNLVANPEYSIHVYKKILVEASPHRNFIAKWWYLFGVDF